MNQNQNYQPTQLNHHQLEILKLFSRNLDDNDLIAIKECETNNLRLLIGYFVHIFHFKNVHYININHTFKVKTMNEISLSKIVVYSFHIPKQLIVAYLGEKITRMVDDVWEEKQWTNEDMKRLLKLHERTPYNPLNKAR